MQRSTIVMTLTFVVQYSTSVRIVDLLNFLSELLITDRFRERMIQAKCRVIIKKDFYILERYQKRFFNKNLSRPSPDY